MEVLFSTRTELSPVWYSDRIGIRNATDTVAWLAPDRAFLARDTDHTWFVVWGASDGRDARPAVASSVPRTSGMGVTATSRHRVSVDSEGTSTLTFVFAGSATSEAEALRDLPSPGEEPCAAAREEEAASCRAARAGESDDSRSRPAGGLQLGEGQHGLAGQGRSRHRSRALGGGLMEYPWWFGTETYSLQALMATGDFELPKHTLRLLRRHSDRTNGNGRIIHEVTGAGAIVNPGNSQETAQFILTVGKLIEWSGDLEFAREMYPAMQRGLAWLLTDMDRDGNMFPGGYGIMEVYGLNAELIDVAVYTQQALAATARVAGLLKDADAANRYRQLASELESRINGRFWIEEEGSYADFFGTRAQAVSAAEGARKQLGLKGEDKLTPRDRELMEPLHPAGASLRQDAGHHERLAHEQELGHRDAAGDGHRPAGQGDTAAGPDPPRERGSLRAVPVGRRNDCT